MMLGSVDPLSSSGINTVTTPATTTDSAGSSQGFASVLGNTVASTGTSASSPTTAASAQGQIFLNQLAQQQSSLANSTDSSGNALLMGLDYQASLAMMQHNMAGLTASESMIAQQMTSMGVGATATAATTGTAGANGTG
jgi:hypothetical protein